MDKATTSQPEQSDQAELSEAAQELASESMRPRPAFLFAGGFFALIALGAYMLAEPGSEASLQFVILVMASSICAFFCILCYRNPRIGNRFFGYDVVLQKEEVTTPDRVQYTGGFPSGSGIDEKRRASKRLSARQTRRQLARTTREMKSGKPSPSDEGPKASGPEAG